MIPLSGNHERLGSGGYVIPLLQGISIVFALCFGLQAAQSPFSGTSKLNVTKSTISPPSPRHETVHVNATRTAFKTDGRTMTVNYTETDKEGNTYKGSDVYEKQ
jgi:hypothetical protein